MTAYRDLTRLRRPRAHVDQPTQLNPIAVPAPTVEPTPADTRPDRYTGSHRAGRHRAKDNR